MLPQLFLNYEIEEISLLLSSLPPSLFVSHNLSLLLILQLKSVTHLPWRAFMYMYKVRKGPSGLYSMFITIINILGGGGGGV